MALNDSYTPVVWSVPPDVLERTTTPNWINAPTFELWPLQRLNQVALIEASLLSGHEAFDYQDAGQILTQTLATKSVVEPAYYAAQMQQWQLYDNLAASPYLAGEGMVSR